MLWNVKFCGWQCEGKLRHRYCVCGDTSRVKMRQDLDTQILCVWWYCDRYCEGELWEILWGKTLRDTVRENSERYCEGKLWEIMWGKTLRDTVRENFERYCEGLVWQRYSEGRFLPGKIYVREVSKRFCFRGHHLDKYCYSMSSVSFLVDVSLISKNVWRWNFPLYSKMNPNKTWPTNLQVQYEHTSMVTKQNHMFKNVCIFVQK